MSMLREKEEVEKNLAVFRTLTKCSHSVYCWLYSEDGELLETDCPTILPHLLFRDAQALSRVLENGKLSRLPQFVETQLGLMWGVVFVGEGEHRRLHVIGPCPLRDIPAVGLEDALRAMLSDFGERETLRRFLSELPVMPPILFQEYLLMLHYCLYGDKLSFSEIHVQSETEIPADKKESEQDSYQSYLAEKALLRCVQDGNIRYKDALRRSQASTGGLQVTVQKPLEQAVVSGCTFVSLCERAAIEGGLSPNTAFFVGDRYIQSLLACRSITELGAISQTMVDDFVRRVRKGRENPSYSKVIRDCVEYIELHPDGDLSTQSLAARFGYADYYLSRMFKKEVGESLNSFINCVRIERARMLLETSDLSVSELAAELQFCSANYFSDTFKSIVGCSPSQYRKEKQG